MSGKENAAADEKAAHEGMGDPNKQEHLTGGTGTQTPSADVDYEDEEYLR